MRAITSAPITPKTLNLDGIVMVPAYPSVAQRLMRVRAADVSQIGLNRLAADASVGIQLPQVFETSVSAVVARTLVADDDATITGASITVTTHRANQLTAAEIGELQVALRPPPPLTDEEVLEHPMMRAYFDRATARYDITVARAAQALNVAASRDGQLRKVIRGLRDEDVSSVRGDEVDNADFDVVDANELEALSYANRLAVLVALTSDDHIRPFTDFMIIAALRSRDPDVQATALVFGSCESTAQGIRSESAAARMRIPQGILDQMAAADPFYGNRVRVSITVYRAITAAEELAINARPSPTEILASRNGKIRNGRVQFTDHVAVAHPTMAVKEVLSYPAVAAPAVDVAYVLMTAVDARFYAMLGYAMLFGRMVTGTASSPVNRAAGGYQVAFGLSKGLHIDSRELNQPPLATVPLPGFRPTDVTPDELANAVVAYAKRPEAHEVVQACGVFSFIKSGHGGTAAGLPNTIQKVASSVGETGLMELATIDVECPVSLYHAPHGLSKRLTLARFSNMARLGVLNFAISRRLIVDGPGIVGYAVAARFFRALDRGSFWSIVGRQVLFDEFVARFAAWYPTAYKEVPYAQYMTGESAPQDMIFRASTDDIMAYAAFTRDIMPASSYGSAPSLRKIAGAAADNDIVAMFQVQGYAAAAVRFNTRLIQQTMRERSTGNRAQAAIEEA